MAGFIKVALPIEEEQVSAHFGHCAEFAFYYVAGAEITAVEHHQAPVQSCSALPLWLAEKKVDVVLARSMGDGMLSKLTAHGIKAVRGVDGLEPREIVQAFVVGSLVADGQGCGHGSSSGHKCACGSR